MRTDLNLDGLAYADVWEYEIRLRAAGSPPLLEAVIVDPSTGKAKGIGFAKTAGDAVRAAAARMAETSVA